jgi:hypothetical protein
MSQIQEISINPPAQGAGGKVTLAAATVGRLQVTQDGFYTLSFSAVTFLCRGTVTTTPVVDVDHYMAAGQQYRVGPLKSGEYLCFISTPGGDVWYTKGS